MDLTSTVWEPQKNNNETIINCMGAQTLMIKLTSILWEIKIHNEYKIHIRQLHIFISYNNFTHMMYKTFVEHGLQGSVSHTRVNLAYAFKIHASHFMYPAQPRNSYHHIYPGSTVSTKYTH